RPGDCRGCRRAPLARDLPARRRDLLLPLRIGVGRCGPRGRGARSPVVRADDTGRLDQTAVRSAMARSDHGSPGGRAHHLTGRRFRCNGGFGLRQRSRDHCRMATTRQPSGTVTLVFTDIEGSTRLLDSLGPDEYRSVLREHQCAVRDAFGRHGGYEVDTAGDGFFYAFSTAADAVRAVEEALAAMAGGTVRIRAGIHTGEPLVEAPKYVGLDVHGAARIMAAAHGGQALLS